MKFEFTFLIEIALLLGVARSQDPLCSTGLPGLFGLAAACCSASCGDCGGPGCGSRPGGSGNCCGTIIIGNNRNCDLVDPPCTIQRDPDCATGRRNDAAGVCCAGLCGDTCGGVANPGPGGCDNAFGDGDDTTARCCGAEILATNRPCSQFAPPCTLEAAPEPSGCSSGLSRNGACCEASCGECGGSGCRRRPGGSSSCCSNAILGSGRSCRNNPPPCVL